MKERTNERKKRDRKTQQNVLKKKFKQTHPIPSHLEFKDEPNNNISYKVLPTFSPISLIIPKESIIIVGILFMNVFFFAVCSVFVTSFYFFYLSSFSPHKYKCNVTRNLLLKQNQENQHIHSHNKLA